MTKEAKPLTIEISEIEQIVRAIVEQELQRREGRRVQ